MGQWIAISSRKLENSNSLVVEICVICDDLSLANQLRFQSIHLKTDSLKFSNLL